MPVIKKLSAAGFEILVWEHRDAEDLACMAQLTSDEELHATTLPPRRRLEYLMVRCLLQSRFPEAKILYQPNGQPVISSGVHISISHSYPLAAVAFTNDAIGIDLERVAPRIIRLKDKFVTEFKLDWLAKIIDPKVEMEVLTALWSTKESLYKADAQKLYSFRDHYFVDEISLSDIFRASVRTSDAVSNYQCRAFRLQQHILTVAQKLLPAGITTSDY